MEDFTAVGPTPGSPSPRTTATEGTFSVGTDSQSAGEEAALLAGRSAGEG